MTDAEPSKRLMQEKRNDYAESSAREALRSNPNSSEAHNNLGTALASRGDMDGAIVEFREALRLNPKNDVARYNLAGVLLQQGRFEEAIVESREGLRLNPGFADAHLNLGNILAKKDDWNGAIHEFREALRLNPNLAEVHDNLGVALSHKGDLDGAAAEHREALRLKPNLAGAHLNLGAILGNKGDRDGEIAEYQEELRLNPDHSAAHYNLGVALGNKDDWGGAIMEFREALQLDPTFGEAHNNLGIALANKDDWDGAWNEFLEALRLNPNNAEVRKNLDAAALHHAKGTGYSPDPDSLALRVTVYKQTDDCKRAFGGQPNTPEVIAQKGHALAVIVVACAQHSYWSLTEVVGDLDKELDGQPPTREQFAPMFLEWIWLYIHLIDRIAFDLIGPKERSTVINALVERTVETLRESAEKESPELKQMADPKVVKAGLMDSFWEILNARQQEYAKCPKLFPEGEEAYSGTLFGEFAERLAALVGRERDLNFFIAIQSGMGHPMTLELLRVAREILPG